MAGRPRYYSEEELLDKAIKVFWKKGYTATSAKDLLTGLGIGQGSLYSTFPGGKKELYQKSLLRFLQVADKMFYEELDKSSCAISFLKKFFTQFSLRSNDEISNGCYLGNATIEFSNLDEETQVMSAKLLNKLKLGFEKALVRAQREGKLSEKKSPKILALHLINLWNGINVTQRMNISKSKIKELINLNLEILD